MKGLIQIISQQSPQSRLLRTGGRRQRSFLCIPQILLHRTLQRWMAWTAVGEKEGGLEARFFSVVRYQYPYFCKMGHSPSFFSSFSRSKRMLFVCSKSQLGEPSCEAALGIGSARTLLQNREEGSRGKSCKEMQSPASQTRSFPVCG